MGVVKDHFVPVDYTKGIWLEGSRNDVSGMVYTLTVDGEPFELSPNAYEKLMAVQFDLIRDGERKAENRIIKLLKDQWLPIADVEACIVLIKGENK